MWTRLQYLWTCLLKAINPSPKLPLDVRLPLALFICLGFFIPYSTGLPWQNDLAIFGILSGIWGAYMLYRESIANDDYLNRVSQAVIASVPGPIVTFFNTILKWFLMLFVGVAYLLLLPRAENYMQVSLILVVTAIAGLAIYGYFWVAQLAFERVKQSSNRSDKDRVSAVKSAFRSIAFYALFAAGVCQLPILIFPP